MERFQHKLTTTKKHESSQSDCSKTLCGHQADDDLDWDSCCYCAVMAWLPAMHVAMSWHGSHCTSIYAHEWTRTCLTEVHYFLQDWNSRAQKANKLQED